MVKIQILPNLLVLLVQDKLALVVQDKLALVVQDTLWENRKRYCVYYVTRKRYDMKKILCILSHTHTVHRVWCLHCQVSTSMAWSKYKYCQTCWCCWFRTRSWCCRFRTNYGRIEKDTMILYDTERIWHEKDTVYTVHTHTHTHTQCTQSVGVCIAKNLNGIQILHCLFHIHLY